MLVLCHMLYRELGKFTLRCVELLGAVIGTKLTGREESFYDKHRLTRSFSKTVFGVIVFWL